MVATTTPASTKIEQQLTVLLRRVRRIHVSTSEGDFDLERSAYGILCRLADEGPQRLGSFASAFGLDPSTITRQVQALERAGLAARETDTADRRASILDLTDEGRDVLERTRAHRRQKFAEALADWSEQDQTELARLLEKLNVTVDEFVAREG